MNEILKDFPDSFESERLTIRAPRPGDGKVVNEAILETIEDLRIWMPWALNTPTVEDSELVARNGYVKWLKREDLLMFLFLKETNTFVGGSGLHRIDWSVPKFEIGYWCRKKFQGQGYVTEAVAAISKFAFEVLAARRVEIRMDEYNIKSKNVAERLGFPLEGLHVNDALTVQGDVRSTLVYAKTV